MNSKKNALVGSGLVVGVAVALGALSGVGRSWSSAGEATAPSKASPGRLEAPASEPLRCRFQVGTELQYAYAARSEVELAAPSAEQGPTAQAHAAAPTREVHEIKSLMHLRVLAAEDPASPGEPSVMTLAMVLEEPIATVAGQRDVELASALSHPVLVRMDEECRVRALSVPGSAAPAVHNAWTLLLKPMELVVPAPGTAPRWTVEQSDPNGSFTALYTRSKSADGRVEVQRVRGDYRRSQDKSSLAGAPAGRVHVARSDARAHFSHGAPWFDDLSATEEATLSSRGARMAEVRTRVEAKRLPEGRASALLSSASLLAEARDFRTTDALLATPRRGLPYADRESIEGLEGRPLPSVLEDVRGRIEGQAKPEFDGALNLLVQYLRRNPGAGRLLANRLRARDLPSDTRSVLILGLQLAGGEDAHASLAEIAGGRSYDHQDKLRALSALGSVPDPDEKVASALFQSAATPGSGREAEEVRQSAMLGLGTLAGAPALDAPTRSRILDQIEKDLTLGRTAEEIQTAMAAAGNAGATSLSAPILVQTKSADPTTVAEAYRALEKLGALPPASDLLKEYLESNNPIVKSVIGGGLTHKKLDASDLARSIELLGEPLPKTDRALFITLVGAHARANQDARAALVTQFRVERDPELLALIGRFLTPSDIL
jgi:hypothetical protein